MTPTEPTEQDKELLENSFGEWLENHGEGIGILTIGSGYWIDTRSASNFVDEIKSIFKDKGIKVVKNGNL